MWDYLLGLSDVERTLIGFALSIFSIVVPIVINKKWSLRNGLKKLINFIFEAIKNFFMILKSLLVKIKSSTHNWLREKIVGKEKIELLNELDKEGIELLKKIKVLNLPIHKNGVREDFWLYKPLINFASLYCDMLVRNYDKIKTDYENHKINDGLTDSFEDYVLKTFIKKCSENNSENNDDKEMREIAKKDVEKILKAITSNETYRSKKS